MLPSTVLGTWDKTENRTGPVSIFEGLESRQETDDWLIEIEAK